MYYALCIQYQLIDGTKFLAKSRKDELQQYKTKDGLLDSLRNAMISVLFFYFVNDFVNAKIS